MDYINTNSRIQRYKRIFWPWFLFIYCFIVPCYFFLELMVWKASTPRTQMLIFLLWVIPSQLFRYLAPEIDTKELSRLQSMIVVKASSKYLHKHDNTIDPPIYQPHICHPFADNSEMIRQATIGGQKVSDV